MVYSAPMQSHNNLSDVSNDPHHKMIYIALTQSSPCFCCGTPISSNVFGPLPGGLFFPDAGVAGVLALPPAALLLLIVLPNPAGRPDALTGLLPPEAGLLGGPIPGLRPADPTADMGLCRPIDMLLSILGGLADGGNWPPPLAGLALGGVPAPKRCFWTFSGLGLAPPA